MKMLDKIIKLVEERDWKEGAFESMAGLPQGRISKWKQAGKGKGPSAKEALVMARILEVSLDWLADDEAELPPKPTGSLDEDERIVLRVYRDLRDECGLTDETATRSLMRAAGITTPTQKAREDMKAPVILTGQAALDAIAASRPLEDPPVVHRQPNSAARPRKKA